MTKKDKAALVQALNQICGGVAVMIALFEDDEAPGKQDKPVEQKPEAPAKVYTYEEVRAILAKKSRTGFRAEVKALLTKHGVTQLSDVKEPEVFTAIVAEAEEIGVGYLNAVGLLDSFQWPPEQDVNVTHKEINIR